MCGRYALTLPPEAVKQYFGYDETPNFPPRYNISPTQPVPIIRYDSQAASGCRFDLMRWGFIPGWVKDLKAFPLVINVRSETAREKPSFRAAFSRRRCLMPADGFYEWHRTGSGKSVQNNAYLFRRPDRSVFAFAALWECWSSPDGSEIDTVALVNGGANGLMSAVHDRCPIIIDHKDIDAWLNPSLTTDQAFGYCRPPSDDLLEMIRISSLVNKVANDRPEVQQPFVAGMATDQPESTQPKPAKQPAQGNLF
jgi:putative SOS response-associated peptidase YedK